MKKNATILSAMMIFLATSAFANVLNDFKSIQFILGSQNVISKIKPTQTLQSIVRNGESFDIRLKNSDGSCVKYNAMVLGTMTNSGEFVAQTSMDEQPQSCN
jgi:hypothetical protein